MNISPVSFGKIVKVNGTKSNAQNILSLANSRVLNKEHKQVQVDAKRIFNDRTKNGPVRIYTQNNGQDIYLFSGKESEIAASTIANAREDIGLAKIFMTDKKELFKFFKKVSKQTNDIMNQLVRDKQEPYTIQVAEHKGQQRIHKVKI